MISAILKILLQPSLPECHVALRDSIQKVKEVTLFRHSRIAHLQMRVFVRIFSELEHEMMDN